MRLCFITPCFSLKEFARRSIDRCVRHLACNISVAIRFNISLHLLALIFSPFLRFVLLEHPQSVVTQGFVGRFAESSIFGCSPMATKPYLLSDCGLRSNITSKGKLAFYAAIRLGISSYLLALILSPFLRFVVLKHPLSVFMHGIPGRFAESSIFGFSPMATKPRSLSDCGLRSRSREKRSVTQLTTRYVDARQRDG